jgi:hypothetical protein
VTGEQLNVAQRAAGLVDKPGSSGDERATAGMGRAAGKTNGPVGAGKPVDDADRRHGSAVFGPNDWTGAARQQTPGGEGGPQCRVDRNAAAAVLFGDAVMKLDGLADLAGRIEHHVPGQPSDLASAQTSFDREQYDQLVAKWVSSGGGKEQEVVYLLLVK